MSSLSKMHIEFLTALSKTNSKYSVFNTCPTPLYNRISHITLALKKTYLKIRFNKVFEYLPKKTFWVVSRPGPQTSTSIALTWILCKLGKQYLVKNFTLPWESNPGPSPIRGGTATLIESVGLKKKLVATKSK